MQIEETITLRSFAVAEPSGTETPGYVEGLRTAITAAVDYTFAAIEHGARQADSVPPAILAQARNAARSRVGLEVVLRRYAAGYSALCDFLLSEIRLLEPTAAEAQYVLQRELAVVFDRLIETVSREYRDEAERTPPSSAKRQAELLRRLLLGELVDASSIDYDFEGHHLGAIASGSGAVQVLNQLASTLDRRLLSVEHGEQTLSAWLGGRRPFDSDQLEDLGSMSCRPDASLVIGEPGQELDGWRLTHRQAKAAWAVALRRPRPFIRYADVALLASTLQDDVLTHHLTATYLEPLFAERDGGSTMLETLRAYFVSGCNTSSTAAALGVARQTVTNRLRVAEERMGRPLDNCGAEMEAALRLADLTASE